MQGLLRTDFDKHPRTVVVQRLETLDELHWRGDLLTENVDHLGLDLGPSGIELAGGVGNEWDRR